MNSKRQTATVHIFTRVYLNHICCNHCNIQTVSISPSSCCRTTTLSSGGSASPSGPPTYITVTLKLSLQQQATCLPLYFITNFKPCTIYTEILLDSNWAQSNCSLQATCPWQCYVAFGDIWNKKTSSKPSLCKVETEHWSILKTYELFISAVIITLIHHFVKLCYK